MPVMGGRFRYFSIQRRSMRSFQRHTQSPWNDSPPQEATACRSPVVIIAMVRCCGWKGRNGSPSANRRMLAASNGPWRTA
jgi:hypothetical protein